MMRPKDVSGSPWRVFPSRMMKALLEFIMLMPDDKNSSILSDLYTANRVENLINQFFGLNFIIKVKPCF